MIFRRVDRESARGIWCSGFGVKVCFIESRCDFLRAYGLFVDFGLLLFGMFFCRGFGVLFMILAVVDVLMMMERLGAMKDIRDFTYS